MKYPAARKAVTARAPWRTTEPAPVTKPGKYGDFDQVNGHHPWKLAVPGAHVPYQARVLRRSKVVYFNFHLAKEMGLLPENHPNKLNAELEKKIVDTFALQIINEFDILTGKKFAPKDVKSNYYMATRYLQIQHDCKRGTTSGDGRSMWNGFFQGASGLWDISSCGTGATKLSPAAALLGKPIRTGDPKVCYGSGTADIDEGLCAAVLSEIFHHRGIGTERTLAVVETPQGNAVNVRASKNLLRPSHVLLYLKQGNYDGAKSALDYYIERQIANGEMQFKSSADKYDSFLKDIATKFARFSAQLEDEYIFCWMDWDGDNMLMTGGIIDYGSVRQLGICHHHYRYDDVERYSTNLKEQRGKARDLVQYFAQMVSFIKTGRRQHLHKFAKSSCLEVFDKEFLLTKQRAMAKRLGFNPQQQQLLLGKERAKLLRFMQEFDFFEKKEATDEAEDTADGINRPVAFRAKALLSGLPKIFLEKYSPTTNYLNYDEFLALIQSTYTPKKFRKVPSRTLEARMRLLQSAYVDLVKSATGHHNHIPKKVWLELTMRASGAQFVANISGDAAINVTDELLSQKRYFSKQEFAHVIDNFIHYFCENPRFKKNRLSKRGERLVKKLLAHVEENRDTI